MKVLIDENLPRKLAGYLHGHECRPVTECGWTGRKNGEMLSLAEPLFDVLLTLDKSVPFQQEVSSRAIAVLILRARSNRIQDLLPFIDECLTALERIRPGQVMRVGKIQNT